MVSWPVGAGLQSRLLSSPAFVPIGLFSELFCLGLLAHLGSLDRHEIGLLRRPFSLCFRISAR